MELKGIHHVTAISATIKRNLDFYVRTMGMRLVKRSVNQDDVSAYHLFYADAIGTPGTDLTFFDWDVRPERRGTHSITRTGMRVEREASLDWWRERLQERGVSVGTTEERDGRTTMDFEDPEGQRLRLVVDGGAGDPPVPWESSPVPAEHQIRIRECRVDLIGIQFEGARCPIHVRGPTVQEAAVQQQRNAEAGGQRIPCRVLEHLVAQAAHEPCDHRVHELQREFTRSSSVGLPWAMRNARSTARCWCWSRCA